MMLSATKNENGRDISMNSAKKSSCILIVDDNAANIRILRDTFAEHGFKVLTANTAESAQKTIFQERGAIDLVLSDIQMPGMTGFDLVKWIKDQGPGVSEIPVLLITSALPEPQNRILGLSLGAVDYVDRNLDSEELVLRVRHAIDHVAELKTLRANLENSETLASTGRLLAASHHEIKNLITVVKATSDSIAKGLRTETTHSASLMDSSQALSTSVDTLMAITRNLAGITASADVPLMSIDLAKEIKTTLNLMQPLLKHIDVSFKEDKSSPQVWVKANLTQLRQILINLLLNAKEAISEHSGVTVGRIKVTIAEGKVGGTFGVAVEDNGVGLPSEETRSEFAPFSSTRQMRGGQGLGLWLCHKLAHDMGGGLTLYSRGPGKGATATLSLRTAPPDTMRDFDISSYFVDNP